jgi:hypothetical protein
MRTFAGCASLAVVGASGATGALAARPRSERDATSPSERAEVSFVVRFVVRFMAFTSSSRDFEMKLDGN